MEPSDRGRRYSAGRRGVEARARRGEARGARALWRCPRVARARRRSESDAGRQRRRACHGRSRRQGAAKLRRFARSIRQRGERDISRVRFRAGERRGIAAEDRWIDERDPDDVDQRTASSISARSSPSFWRSASIPIRADPAPCSRRRMRPTEHEASSPFAALAKLKQKGGQGD